MSQSELFLICRPWWDLTGLVRCGWDIKSMSSWWSYFSEASASEPPMRTTQQSCVMGYTRVSSFLSRSTPLLSWLPKRPRMLRAPSNTALCEIRDANVLEVCFIHISSAYLLHLHIYHRQWLHDQPPLEFSGECSSPLEPQEGAVSSTIDTLARCPPNHSLRHWIARNTAKKWKCDVHDGADSE